MGKWCHLLYIYIIYIYTSVCGFQTEELDQSLRGGGVWNNLAAQRGCFSGNVLECISNVKTMRVSEHVWETFGFADYIIMVHRDVPYSKLFGGHTICSRLLDYPKLYLL